MCRINLCVGTQCQQGSSSMQIANGDRSIEWSASIWVYRLQIRPCSLK